MRKLNNEMRGTKEIQDREEKERHDVKRYGKVVLINDNNEDREREGGSNGQHEQREKGLWGSETSIQILGQYEFRDGTWEKRELWQGRREKYYYYQGLHAGNKKYSPVKNSTRI